MIKKRKTSTKTAKTAPRKAKRKTVTKKSTAPRTKKTAPKVAKKGTRKTKGITVIKIYG